MVYREQEISFDVDADWDPTMRQIDSLREMKEEMEVAHRQRINDIDEQIANLLALPAPKN